MAEDPVAMVMEFSAFGDPVAVGTWLVEGTLSWLLLDASCLTSVASLFLAFLAACLPTNGVRSASG